MTPVEQTNSFARMAAQAARSFFHGFYGDGIARIARRAIALPAFTITPRMRPLEAIRFALETTTGAATTRFLVKTAAAEAGTSL